MRALHTKGLALAAAALAAVSLAACGAGKKDDGGGSAATTGVATGATSGSTSGTASSSSSGTTSSSAPAGGKSLTIGTTDQVVALDPAYSYDFGSQFYENNIYQYLMIVPPNGTKPELDAAQKCGFTNPTTYTCTLKSGLKFSNGDPVTAQDVVYSYTRVAKIADPAGPSALIGNMASVKATNAMTVAFTLKNANDQTWPFILGTAAGPIVDHKIYPATSQLADAKAVGSGPYMIKSFNKNQQATLVTNPDYTGANKGKVGTITVRTYTESSNLKLDIQSNAIDIAYRTLTPSDISNLKSNSAVKVVTGQGAELRYLVFNLKTMPGSDDKQKLAIRQAMAYSVDRTSLANDVYKGTYQPAYSMVPQGVNGATESFKDAYGTSPNADKAKQVLQAAGVSTPVSLNIEYTTDHYGPTSPQEYGAIKRQLEGTGLFKVQLNSAPYTTYSTERTKDTYPIYQLGWYPDYLDADDYLSPFLAEGNFVGAHYCDKGATNRPCDQDGVLPLLKTETTQSGAARTQALAKLQTIEATKTMPTLPLLQGKQVAVTGTNVTGVADTLDPTYEFRFWLLDKTS